MMKGTLLVALLAAGHPIGAQEARAECTRPAEDEARTAHRQVSWEDFQGAPLRRSFGRMPGRLVAKHLIATAITVEPFEVEVARDSSGQWVGRPRGLCVRAVLYKDRSQSRPDEQTDRGLAHEQGHFDVTESFARRLRARLPGVEHRAGNPREAEQGARDAVERVYREVVVQWRATQERYDRETRHNLRQLAQKRWLEQIDAMLQ
jgi:hypothetical protein